MSLFEPSADRIAAYQLSLFGDCQLWDEDQHRLLHLGRKARALVAYLALERDKVTRDELATLLWSDRGFDQARASLRQACFELRHALPQSQSLLIFTRDEVVLARARLITDVDFGNGAYRSAASLAAAFVPARRVLLRDMNDLSPAFDEWLRVERVRRADERRKTTLHALHLACADERWSDAQCIARAFLTMEPIDEEIAFVAVSASIHLAQTDEALRLYRLHAEAMRDELDSEPARAIAGLVDESAAAPDASRGADPRTAPPSSEVAAVEDRKHPNVDRNSSKTAARAGSIRRPLVAAGIGVLTIGIIAAARQSALAERSPMPVVTIDPFTVMGNDATARWIGTGLSTMVARDLVGTETPIEIVDGTRRKPDGASIVVRGTTANAGGLLRADVQLVVLPSARVVWAGAFNRPVGEAVQFGEQLALRIARELNCAYSDDRARYFADPEFARLSLAHCDLIDGDSDEALNLSRQITERAPRFAHGWAEHAYDLAEKSFSLPPKLADHAVAQAKREAERATAMNPRDGLAYTAQLITMTSPLQFNEREALIRHGLAQAPQDARLYMAKANDMWGLGRLQDALEAARRASQYNAFLPGMVVEQAGLEGDLGDLQEARRLIRKAQILWPQQRFVDRLAYRLALYWGNPDEAMALLAAERITGYSEGHLAADRAFAAWRKKPSAVSATAALRVIERVSSAGPVDSEYVQILAAMGMIDEAYRLAERLPPFGGSGPGWYRDYMARFRADRRFMPLAARLGVAQTWLQTGLWPDFCREESLPYNCLAAARSAVSTTKRSITPNRT